nr:AmNV_32 [Apis mellifera nudivirus]
MGSLLVALTSIHSGRRTVASTAINATAAITHITPLINASVDQDNGGMYELSLSLAVQIKQMLHLTRNIKSEDLAITSLMLLFSRFYAANQYPLFIDTFRALPELERFERFVNEYGRSTVRLPVNLATDEKWGLAKIASTIRHPTYPNAHITLAQFDNLILMMRVPGIQVDQFVAELLKASYHPHILEAFYMFTSITRESRVVMECRELSVRQRLVGFKFPRPIQSTEIATATMWFTVPHGSIWFAYHEGHWTYQSYVGRDADALVERTMVSLKNINGIVIGYMHEGKLFPVQLDGPIWSGRWQETHRQLLSRSLNSPHREGKPPTITTTTTNGKEKIFFVKEGIASMFRLIK